MTTSARVGGALVFTDLAGFTAYTAERGDDAAVALVERFGRIVAGALPRRARVVKELGDGLFLFVESPLEAVVAALTFVERCAGASTPDAPLWVRTGIHVGSAIRRGSDPATADLIGHDVNVASRITALASPSEVLASEATRRAVESAAEGDHAAVCFEPIGPVFVKGIEDPIRLSRVRRAPPS